MNYCEILKSDIANGTGIRVSLFVSGCTHRCKGCFNAMTWPFEAGHPFTREVEDSILAALAPDWVTGLTLLGGEPMEPANQPTLVAFCRRVREILPAKTIWCYTGCVYEKDLLAQEAARRLAFPPPQDTYWRTPVTDEFLSMIDVLVDGPFVESLKDISLKFRGSSNQRILVRQSDGTFAATQDFIRL